MELASSSFFHKKQFLFVFLLMDNAPERQMATCFPVESKKNGFTELENRIVATRDWGEKGKQLGKGYSMGTKLY
jgi:hypothetical protein